MKSISGKELAKALDMNGWRLLRVSGSHYIYGKQSVKARLSVPIHGNKPLKKGLAKFLMKSAGLSEEDL